MSINYIICAAGLGTRFRNLLPNKPKPLIKIHNKTSLEISLDSLQFFLGDKIIIITQKSHCVKKELGELLRSKYPQNELTWLEIEEVTKGQLATAYLAKNLLNLDDAIAVFNCDTFFQSREFAKLTLDKTIEGIIPCARADGTSWSFCKIDEGKNVTDIKEKERISDLASVGLYYFRDAKKFLKLTEQELNEPAINGEYYVANLYRRYLAEGVRLVVADVEIFKPLGTPEQLKEYWDIVLTPSSPPPCHPVE